MNDLARGNGERLWGSLMEMAQKKMKEHGMDMNNMNPEEMEKAGKAIDSAGKMLDQMKDSLK